MFASFEDQPFRETLNETCVNNVESKNMPYWICRNLSSKRVYMPFWKYRLRHKEKYKTHRKALQKCSDLMFHVTCIDEAVTFIFVGVVFDSFITKLKDSSIHETFLV